VRAVLGLAALALAACGSPAAGPALSEGEFVGQAGLICLELERQAQVTDDGLLAFAGDDGSARLADAQRVVGGFAPVVADARTRLAALRPPDARRPATDAYLAALEAARSQLVSTASSPEATRRFLASGSSVLADLDADEAAAGLQACARGPEADAGHDEEAKNAVRTALLTEQLILAGDGAFSESLDDLRLLQPDGRYEVGPVPTRTATVAVTVDEGGALVLLGARSRSGTCFYVAAGADGTVGYAADPACRPADAQDFGEQW